MNQPVIPVPPTGIEDLAPPAVRGAGLDRPAPVRAVASWILYDLANTVFSMGVISLYFSEWLRGQVGPERADVVLGSITSVSMGIIFIISPLLGAMSDRARRRMPFLFVSTVLCVGMTALMGSAGYRGTIIAFVLANAAYQAGLQFYDSLLVEVTTETNRGRIGGLGIGLGYVGSYIAVGIGLVLGADDLSLVFTLIAIAFLALATPCFVFVVERGNPNAGNVFDPRFVWQSTKRTLGALRDGRSHPGLVRFLVGRMFYTDAINTVISFMTLFALNVFALAGVPDDVASKRKNLVLMAAISFAIVGGVIWGCVVDRIGPKRTLTIVLGLWVATFSLACAMGIFAFPSLVLWIVAAMAGIAIGGTWSADRPLMLRLTPPDRVGEFYGLYGMVGRFSAILGPVLWGEATAISLRRFGVTPDNVEKIDVHLRHVLILRSQGVAVAVLLVMILVSWWILRPVDDSPRDWAKLQARAAH